MREAFLFVGRFSYWWSNISLPLSVLIFYPGHRWSYIRVNTLTLPSSLPLSTPWDSSNSLPSLSILRWGLRLAFASLIKFRLCVCLIVTYHCFFPCPIRFCLSSLDNVLRGRGNESVSSFVYRYKGPCRIHCRPWQTRHTRLCCYGNMCTCISVYVLTLGISDANMFNAPWNSGFLSRLGMGRACGLSEAWARGVLWYNVEGMITFYDLL